jgi:hypothetical protein
MITRLYGEPIVADLMELDRIMSEELELQRLDPGSCRKPESTFGAPEEAQ